MRRDSAVGPSVSGPRDGNVASDHDGLGLKGGGGPSSMTLNIHCTCEDDMAAAGFLNLFSACSSQSGDTCERGVGRKEGRRGDS